MSAKVNICYVLAGGRSRRMGTDKLFIRVGDTTLLERTILTCGVIFNSVKLVAKSENKFSHLTVPILRDLHVADGPLAGVITALQDCADPYCFITAADLYDLHPFMLLRLTEEYNGEDFLGIDEGGCPQPLCGIYSKSALPRLRQFAERCDNTMREALKTLSWRTVPLNLKHWRNINTPSDFSSIRSNHG